MKRSAMPILMAILLALLLAATLAADTLILRDGRRVEGQLVSVVNGQVEFIDAQQFGGRTLRFNRDDIVGIEFNRNGRFDRNDGDNRDQGRLGGPPVQNGRPAGLRERQIMVGATVRLVDTNIDVQAGQNVYFEASGDVHWGPNRHDGPNGEQNSPVNAARPMPNRPAAALIGCVGQSGSDFFYIGAERGAFRMRSSGRLFLAVNDDYLQDNSGAFRVVVYY